MCGGYQIWLDADQLQCVHEGANWRNGHADRYNPRTSVRPTTFAPVFVRSEIDAHGTGVASGAGGVEIAMMKWGLVPSWTRPNEANKVNVLINARRETVTELPSFARALNSRISRRCVVASTGFYEWERGPSRTSRKTPYLIRLHHETSSGDSDGRVLLMAGVYDVWKTPDRSELYSFAICTTATSEQFSWLHDRLPCILETEADVTAWLDVAGLPGRAAAATVLRTAAAPLEWTRMSADLATPVGKPSSRAVKQDVTAYFSAGGAKTGAAKAPFPKSFAERVGLDLLPSPAKLAQLDTPIKKAHAAGSARRSPPGKASRAKASPKKSAAKGQRSITSFFRKQGENG